MPDEQELLPPPSASTILFRVQSLAIIDALGPKRGRKFVTSMAQRLANEESVADTLPIRPDSQKLAVRKARREAVGLFRRLLPVFTARL